MVRVSDAERGAIRFEPIRPATPGRLVAGALLGSLLWLLALAVAAVLLHLTSAIELGLAVAGASFLISMVLLGLLLASRRRRERRYVDVG